MQAKKWLVAPCDKELAAQIAQEQGLNPYAALLAVSRGITAPEDLDAFFSQEDELTVDPLSFADMQPAVRRIRTAIEQFERIAVVGDYDADGVTSTALLCSYLEARDADFLHDIPDRLADGYGLSKAIIDRLCKQNVKLIITVDNGISAVEEVAYANSLGIDTVVTDHHIPGETLPPAVAVVDPHRADCPSEFKEYAGVGVAFKLICALQDGEDDHTLLEEFGFLVAIGTIADVVPLTGENRALVRSGVRQMQERPCPGLAALAEVAGFQCDQLTAMRVAFTVAPRLNAVGRMGSAEPALQLLLATEFSDAEALARQIDAANAERQKIEAQITALVEQQLRAHPQRRFDRVIVCAGEHWHGGVIGIVAARIVERYGRPCLLISSDGEIAKGSGRSLAGFSLFDALSACSDVLEGFGGHTLAAGLTVRTDRIAAFRRRINDYAAQEEMPFPTLRIDIRLNPKSVGVDITDALQSMEPFGAGNPQPIFGLFKMQIEKITPVSNGKHLRLQLTRGDVRLYAMRFGVSPDRFPFAVGDTVDLAVTLEKNLYQGEVRVNIHIRGIRFSAFEEEQMLEGVRIYETLRRAEAPTCIDAEQLIPTRDTMGEIYLLLKRSGGWTRGEEALCAALGHYGTDVCSVLLALDILEELRLITIDENGCITRNPTAEKVSIEDSRLLQQAKMLTEDDGEEGI